VRVGIHTGVSSVAEMQYNSAAARIVYGGPCVAVCKAVADLAHGGQVLLSGAARAQLEEAVHHHNGGRPAGTLVGVLQS
jgi:class 3 adenylate cyclase